MCRQCITKTSPIEHFHAKHRSTAFDVFAGFELHHLKPVVLQGFVGSITTALDENMVPIRADCVHGKSLQGIVLWCLDHDIKQGVDERQSLRGKGRRIDERSLLIEDAEASVQMIERRSLSSRAITGTPSMAVICSYALRSLRIPYAPKASPARMQSASPIP
jgi:hypothetical protein